MNYKTTRKGDGELLLSSGGNWVEHSVIPTESQRSSQPSDTATVDVVIDSSPNEKLLPTNEAKNVPDIQQTNSSQRSETRILGEDKNCLSPITSDIVNKNESNDNRERSRASCLDWILFEESNNDTINLQHPATIDVLTTSREEADDGDLARRSKGVDWVKFDSSKADASHLCNSLSQLGDSHGNRKEVTGPDSREELRERLLQNDVFTEPFDNSELDRINSFSRVSAKPDSLINSSHHQESLPPVNVPQSASDGPQKTGTSTARGAGVLMPTEPSDDPSPLPEYPYKLTNTTWSVLLRYPDTKRKLRTREWRPVILKLDGSVLQVFEEHDTTAPFREISLQCFYSLTAPKLQTCRGSKVHTVKILYVKYKELHKRLSKKNVQYIARTTPILKIASSSHLVIREFTEAVKDAIRSLPIFRDRGISHNTEAVYINVHDTCSVLLDSAGAVLMLGILVRIYLRAFVSGDAECQLVLNDVHSKSQEESRLREELMPQRVHKWINIEKCDFHSTVNPSAYSKKHYILLQPLDSCTFEVMRFRVPHLKPLPLLAKCDVTADGHGRVELKAEVKLCSDPKLAKYDRNNVCLYFSIPESWIWLFMKEKLFRGEKSIKSTSAQKAIKMRNRTNRPTCTIEVSTGSAKYEPEYKAVVWRINHLPLLNTTAPADSSHDFTCVVHTPNTSGLPDDFEPQCVMEYEIPYTVASDTNVVNFKVSDKKIATQEVSYHTYYSYHIQMNMTCLNGGLTDER